MDDSTACKTSAAAGWSADCRLRLKVFIVQVRHLKSAFDTILTAASARSSLSNRKAFTSTRNVRSMQSNQLSKFKFCLNISISGSHSLDGDADQDADIHMVGLCSLRHMSSTGQSMFSTGSHILLSWIVYIYIGSHVSSCNSTQQSVSLSKCQLEVHGSFHIICHHLLNNILVLCDPKKL